MIAQRNGKEKRKAVFLDRDGTLNVDFGYVHSTQEWEWVSGAINGLKRLYDAGFALVIVTNQAGIARGYYEAGDVDALHEWVQLELISRGVKISGIYYCPHHPDFGVVKQCNCRKPEPGMLIQAAQELCLDLSRSWMIGDQYSDTQAGLRAGAKAILIGRGDTDGLQIKDVSKTTHHAPNIAAAVSLILADK